ncbi:hypothetical protein [uncultured Moraxella sp.]|uniref:hypothetical protein n=1 Tax=uncultured Moraxella sp. TaxID=263769 RepID=UPI0025EB2C1E|nr:hypothetical protein [uncultured Moraxella sp.]
MKQAITSLTVLAIAITPNLANANQAENQKKITVVKKVYQNINKRHTIIINNATPDFKQAIRYDDAITPDGEMNCQAWDMVGGVDPKIRQVKYTVLKNGKVRATFKNYGKTEYNDFQLQKVNGKYLIADIWGTGYQTSFMQGMAKCQQYGL